VLQLSYEPAGGVPQLFNLRIIAVESGFLNLGIQYENGEIAVYNDLGPGLRKQHTAVSITTLEQRGARAANGCLILSKRKISRYRLARCSTMTWLSVSVTARFGPTGT
jgi:hypothetical protein